MIDKIFNLFFEKNKKSCLTVIKDRKIVEDASKDDTVQKKPLILAVKKDLNSYFANCVGLNVKERKAFNNAVVNAQRQR